MAWIERADKRERKAKHYQDSENPSRFRAEFTIHDRHYHDGNQWQDVDESIVDDGADGFAKKCDKANHIFRIANGGTQRWYPRRNISGEYVSILNIQYWRTQGGGSWGNINLPTPVWRGNGADWDLANLSASLTHTWRTIKTSFVLKDSTAPTRLRFELGLTGLTLDTNTWEVKSGTNVVGSIPPPTFTDANELDVPVTTTYSGGYIEWSVNPAGFTYPLTSHSVTFTDGYGGDTQTYKDTFLRRWDGFYSDDNYGTATIPPNNWLQGSTSDGGSSVRMLLLFDLTNIPAGATCNSAVFSLYKTDVAGSNYPNSLGVWEILSANSGWNEGTKNQQNATTGEPCWDYKSYNTVRWAGDTGSDGGADAGCTVAGTDIGSSSMDTCAINRSDAQGTEYQFDLTTTLVDDWFGASTNNYGILVTSVNTSPAPVIIASSDHATTGYRPKLVVVYETPANNLKYWKYGLPVQVDAGDTSGGDYWKYGLPVFRYAPSGTSTSNSAPAFLKGQSDASTSVPAYSIGSLPADSSQDVYLKGEQHVTTNQTAYTKGSAETLGSVPVFLQGQVGGSSSLPGYLYGRVVDLTTSRSAYLEGGSGTGLSSQPVYLKAEASTSGQVTSYIHGKEDTSHATPAYTQGQDTTSDAKPGYLAGTADLSDSVHTYLCGYDSSTSKASAYLAGQSTGSSSRAAYLQGQAGALASSPAYLTGGLNPASRQPAYLLGRADATTVIHAYLEGGSGTSASSKAAFLKAQDTLAANQPAFTHGFTTISTSQAVVTTGSLESTGYRFAYTKGTANTTTSQAAFLAGGITTTTSRAAFIKGQDNTTSSIHAFIPGAGDVSTSITAYIKGQNDTQASAPVYIQGSLDTLSAQHVYLGGSDTADTATPAFTLGMAQGTSSLAGYTAGTTTTQSNQLAYTHGQVQTLDHQVTFTTGGIETNSSRLAFLQGTSVTTSSLPAYTEGYVAGVSGIRAYLKGWGQIIYPDGDVSTNGVWHNELEGTELYPSLDEHPSPDDSDYAYLTGTPTVGMYFEESLSNPATGLPGTGNVTIYWRGYDRNATGTCTVVVELRQGATVIGSMTQVLSGTPTTYSFMLTAEQKAQITDWNDLRVRVRVA